MTNERFISEVFLECFCRAHRNLFGRLEIVTVVEYIVLRMRSALHESWTERKTVLQRCILQGSVSLKICTVSWMILLGCGQTFLLSYATRNCHMLKIGSIALVFYLWSVYVPRFLWLKEFLLMIDAWCSLQYHCSRHDLLEIWPSAIGTRHL